MADLLRFGIPSLDTLFGGKTKRQFQTPTAGNEKSGILLPDKKGTGNRSSSSAASICIIGPDGTGKSVLALHLASRYFADCLEGHSTDDDFRPPKILYVSTDLKFSMAHTMWENFALDRPFGRTVPFADQKPNALASFKVNLVECVPLGTSKQAADSESVDKEILARALRLSETVADIRNNNCGRVYFVDLASSTVGDDWGFINRLLAVLEDPGGPLLQNLKGTPVPNHEVPSTDPPTSVTSGSCAEAAKEPANQKSTNDKNSATHLVIIDSVDGFEVLVGEKDAFGEFQPRRSRIARVMRTAGEKSHVAFISEECRSDAKLPEEFVTDVVIRLRSVSARDYIRRTVEIEKARGQSHVRGQHPYAIRAGGGSTTGGQTNQDDLEVVSNTEGKAQSYVHVFHSLHKLNRRIVEDQKGDFIPSRDKQRYAGFGIPFLDDMLAGEAQKTEQLGGSDSRGLPCSTTTALIGDPETQKTQLGIAFLSRCFTSYTERFCEVLKAQSKPDRECVRYLRQAIANHLRAVCKQDEKPDKAPADVAEFSGWYEAISQQPLKEKNLPPLPSNNDWGAYLVNLRERLGESEDYRSRYIRPTATSEESLTELRPDVSLALWLLSVPDQNDDGVPVLLATRDISVRRLSGEIWRWLRKQNQSCLRSLDVSLSGGDTHVGRAIQRHIEEHSICRRLEIHDMASPVLIHLLYQNIRAAQKLIFHGENLGQQERFEKSSRIRLVVDDFSILRKTYSEVIQDPLLLPFLMFYLRRRGVTSLFIDTQSARPDRVVTDPMERALRTLAHQHLYTWRFPFYGENRIAIAALPPISNERKAVVRELREVPAEALRGAKEANEEFIDESLLEVDPGFELYTGIEEGRPQPVALEVRLFVETPAFEKFIAEENLSYRELFTPINRELGEARNAALVDTTNDVIIGVQVDQYDAFRDFCYLQRDTRLDYTLVFQVDEFWALRRPDPRRAGAFMTQDRYLTALTADEMGRPDHAVDPFGVFQNNIGQINPSTQNPNPQRAEKRHQFFQIEECGYQDVEQGGPIDRIPFTWDFGFVLCRNNLWDAYREEELPILNQNSKKTTAWTVREVWERLPKVVEPDDSPPLNPDPRATWREFLEACHVISHKHHLVRSAPVPAFDWSAVSLQSFSCLILEIWGSEILDSLEVTERPHFVEQFSERKWHQNGGNRDGEEGLIRWVEQYKLQLFKTWLLLVEVLDFSDMSALIRRSGPSTRRSASSAVAARYWYKTACALTETFSPEDPLVPVGLPGRFSVRGDWFLAVAGGSRSPRLADRALDLLSSRRSNFTRLAKGAGLPTRDVGTGYLPTNLPTIGRGHRQTRVTYAELCKLGALPVDPKASSRGANFHWLWRSQIEHYSRHAKIWQDWLSRIVLWWEITRMKSDEKEWVNGFQRYDELSSIQSEDAVELNQLQSWEKFSKFADSLKDSLKQATPARLDSGGR